MWRFSFLFCLFQVHAYGEGFRSRRFVFVKGERLLLILSYTVPDMHQIGFEVPLGAKSEGESDAFHQHFSPSISSRAHARLTNGDRLAILTHAKDPENAVLFCLVPCVVLKARRGGTHGCYTS